jgi:hypothetical protein
VDNKETLVQFPTGKKDICLPHIQHAASYSMDRGELQWGQSGLCMKLTTDLHLVSILIMSGAVSVLLYMPLWREQGKLITNY